MNVCVDRYGKRSGGEWRIARPQTASSTTAKRRLILQKKKKYYQFITSLLLEEPLCTAWLTSARARPTRAEGRAQQRGPRPGPAVQGRRGQPGSRLPLPCPPPRPSAKGLSGGEEGWRAEGVYSPACRTRYVARVTTSCGITSCVITSLWAIFPVLYFCHTREIYREFMDALRLNDRQLESNIFWAIFEA